jgi:hypothetical protein
VGVYKSLTDTWMWKLGLRPRSFFSGNRLNKSHFLCSALTSKTVKQNCRYKATTAHYDRILNSHRFYCFVVNEKLF